MLGGVTQGRRECDVADTSHNANVDGDREDSRSSGRDAPAAANVGIEEPFVTPIGLAEHSRKFLYLGFAGGCLAVTMVALIAPRIISSHFPAAAGVDVQVWQRAWDAVLRGMVGPGVSVAAIAVAYYLQLDQLRPRVFSLITYSGLCCSYISLVQVLSGWMVDDAAITFAFSENFATGHGLVLHPGLPREEAYSTTSWMLILAGMRWLGFSVAASAKALGVLFAIAALTASAWTTQKLLPSNTFARLAPLLLVLPLGAPFIIWSVSGLEHSFEAALLAAIVAAAVWRPESTRAATVCLTLLALTRPEAPLLVAAVFSTYTIHAVREGRPRAWIRHWPVALIPAAAYLGLLVFRLDYFGALLPNPFYAKATKSTFSHLLNLQGGGWEYVLGWMAHTGVQTLLPFIPFLPRSAPLAVRLTLSLVIAQFVFTIYAGGDWMGCYRFTSAITPLLAVPAGVAVAAATRSIGRHRALLLSSALACFLALASARALAEFRADPTTPVATVTHVGERFVALAKTLGVRSPTLAHHDAGGTSYRSGIVLIDFAGLGNRTIARHMDDPQFIRDYVFETVRPTFVFGTDALFAAGKSRLRQDPRFEQRYLPVEFVGDPLMNAALSHVRRDLVHAAPGLELVAGTSGQVERLRVLPY